MNLPDLVEMELIKLRRTEPRTLDLKGHAQIKHTLRAIRRRVENDVVSKSSRLTLEEDQEIKVEVLEFKGMRRKASRSAVIGTIDILGLIVRILGTLSIAVLVTFEDRRH